MMGSNKHLFFRAGSWLRGGLGAGLVALAWALSAGPPSAQAAELNWGFGLGFSETPPVIREWPAYPYGPYRTYRYGRHRPPVIQHPSYPGGWMVPPPLVLPRPYHGEGWGEPPVWVDRQPWGGHGWDRDGRFRSWNHDRR